MNDTSEVKLHFLDYWRVIKLRFGLILLAFFLVMVTAGITTYFLPRQYLANVKMEVKQDNSGPVQVFGGAAQRSYDPQFVTTQFQILQTTEILYPVIDRLDLIKEYSPPGVTYKQQQVFYILRRAMQLQEIRNTGLIQIGVYDTDPQRAANIANTIAVVYQEKRRSDLQKNVDRGLEQLDEEVRKQRKIVEDASADAMKLRASQGIIDDGPDKENSNIGSANSSRMFSQQALNEQQLKVVDLERQLDLIQNLKPEELLQALRTLNIDDPTVLKNLPLFQDATAEEARLLSSGLGENHPRVRSLRAQKDAYSKILSDGITSIRRAQANKLRYERDKLSVVEAKAGESRKAEIDEKMKVNDYIVAKNKYVQARKLSENVEMTLAAEKMKRQVDSQTARIWEKAEPPAGPAKPNVTAYMALAAVVGLVIGVGLAFFIEYLDTSVKTLDDVERYLQIPVLAVIPKNVSVLMNLQGDTPDAEAYRILRANVEFNKPHRDANTFTLISGGPGEGKSTTLNNLAFTCAKGGYNVLVVDADLRRATQHTIFNVPNDFGLTDYLLGNAEIDDIVKTTKIDNLSFIPAGQLPGESVGILNSQRMTEMIAKVKQQYDLVFFDSPPILGVSDGSVLASEVDMTIMVVQHRRFPRAMLQRVKQAVYNVGGHLIGVVLNNVDAKHDEGYSYYSTYNDYYGAKPTATARVEGKPAPQLARPRTTGEREEY